MCACVAIEKRAQHVHIGSIGKGTNLCVMSVEDCSLHTVLYSAVCARYMYKNTRFCRAWSSSLKAQWSQTEWARASIQTHIHTHTAIYAAAHSLTREQTSKWLVSLSSSFLPSASLPDACCLCCLHSCDACVRARVHVVVQEFYVREQTERTVFFSFFSLVCFSVYGSVSLSISIHF